MENPNWQKYTITAILGIIAGVMTTFTHTTIDNTSRIAALEATSQLTISSLGRIEAKLDRK